MYVRLLSSCRIIMMAFKLIVLGYFIAPALNKGRHLQETAAHHASRVSHSEDESAQTLLSFHRFVSADVPQVKQADKCQSLHRCEFIT